jgi:type 2 lantibiotic biosynthesis protein LanM
MSPVVGEANFRDANWLKGLTLQERAATLAAPGPAAQSITAADAGRAEKRLARWRALPSFDDESYFLQRLEAEQLTEAMLLSLLAESAESLSERVTGSPSWLTSLERAFHGYSSPAGETAPDSAESGAGKYKGLLKGIAPLIEQGVNRVRDGVRRLQAEYVEPPFEPEAVVKLTLNGLVMKLLGHASRTIALELNVARLKGILKGETPQERFEDFNRLIARPDYLLPILCEYPVLTRQFVTTIDYWVVNYLELLNRLCADWAEIVETFSPGRDLGRLTEVAADAGDTHREGRSVSILVFESGLRLVYKPRSLSVDVHFKELLEWLNERGDHPPFRPVRVVNRDGYGWAEFIKAEECSSADELRLFYRRQGGLLALLYALQATDFHLENLIAAGAHPVLIDLESLFHPRMKQTLAQRQGLAPAARALSESVMRVGMLPHRAWAFDEGDGIDMSGLGGTAGQLTPFPILSFENQATDELRAVRKRVEMPGAQNRPTLRGAGIDLQDYIEDVSEGFTAVYRLLLRERGALLAADGPLSKFAGDEVRAVLRATQTYAIFQTESFHPDVLRDALDRSRLFDRLWELGRLTPQHLRALPSEIRDLQQGDIPFFSSRPGSRDLWTSRNEHVPDFFEEDSLTAVRRCIEKLDEADLARQRWFIAASISSLKLGLDQKTSGGPAFGGGGGDAGASRERLLDAARLAADRLEGLAIRDEANINWIGLALMGGRKWTLLPLTDALYDGTGGIALFLAYLGDVLGEERYTALARRILSNTRGRLDAAVRAGQLKDLHGVGPGGYNGFGGIIHVFSHASQLWKDASLLASAEAAAELLPPLIAADKSLDIINGSAGCILNLLALYQCNSSPRALAIARLCADRLLQEARRMPQGIAWDTAVEGRSPLTGFSHGATGIGHALLELGTAAGEERYVNAGLDAFRYERSVISAAEENWPDFRSEEGEAAVKSERAEKFMWTWCHGAPGIGLGRLRALQRMSDEQIRADLRVAVKSTLERGGAVNYSLCHGSLGNLEFLSDAGRYLGDDDLLGEVRRHTASLLDGIHRRGWVCGTPNGTETPGLMTGVSGIGYGLLRLAEPERVPSVLTLAPAPKKEKL